jgi:predicted acylesterase/phospholipase RssA
MRNFLLAILPAIAAAKDACHALVMSGGGANGAWEAGVFWGLNYYGTPGNFDYDVITGVSAGSINTLALAGWAPSDGMAAAEYMSETLQNLTNSDVWVEWPLGLVEGATVKPGLLNDGPLFQFLRNQLAGFPEGYKRRVTLAAVNVETGEYTTFNQDNTSFFDLPHAAVSSASIPFVFPPHVWSRGTFMDGGTVWNVNIDSAVQQCMELVDDQSKIIVDVVVCGSPPSPDSRWTPGGDAVENFLFSRNIHHFYSSSDNLAEERMGYPNVNFRYLFIQKEYNLSGKAELQFDNATTWPLQENGRQIAQETLAAGEGTVFKLLDEYHKDAKIKKEYGHFINYLNAKQPSK